MEKQNITLAIPKDVLQKAKLLAVKRGTSLSSMLSQYLVEIVAGEERYEAARRRHSAILDSGRDLGTQGLVSWTREDLHARSG